MIDRTGYRSHSGYTSEAGGITRLDAIVDALESLTGGEPAGRSRLRVLDLGCGTGSVAIPIASLGYPVTGLDVHEPSVAIARSRCPFARATFATTPPEALKPGSFEVAVLSEVLEHLADPGACLAAVHRLLSPGGRLVVTVPNGRGPWETMNRCKSLAGLIGLGGWLSSLQRALGYTGRTIQSENPHLEHLQFFTNPALVALAGRSGFGLERVSPLTFVVTVFPCSWIFRMAPSIERFDAALARVLPLGLASGWLFVFSRKDA